MRILPLAALGGCPSALWAESALPLPAPLSPAHCGPLEMEGEAGVAGEIELEAGRMTREGDRMELRSDVRARYGAWRARADAMSIDEKEGRASLDGGVSVSGPGLTLEAGQAELEYASGRAEATDARYRLAGGGTGRAQQLVRNEDGVLEVSQASYSTCALEDPTWSLEAETVKIDAAKGQGWARNAVLRVGSVPVMVMPWVGFPVGSARKSGWLTPELGTSDDLGYSLELPYYLNLAPHYDAVMSARYMGRRGLQVRPSGRYRTRHGGGAVEGEFLSDAETDDDRYLLHWRHGDDRPSGWSWRVNYANVSDGAYLEDFDSGVHGLSTTRLRQEGHVAWRSRRWNFSAAVTGSEPLKGRSEQWDRLPRIRLKGKIPLPAGGLVLTPHFALDAFRGDLAELGYRGERYDAGLTFGRRFAGPGWQLTPSLQWRHTQYDLEFDAAYAAAQRAARGVARLDRTPSRTLPIFSLVGKARFERLLDGGAVQTLEPQFLYLNRQKRDQRDLPIFDTRLMDPDFDTLFRIARAAGRDRIGPADLLAAGVTTRVIDPASGRISLRARLGRVWFFRPRGASAEGDHAKTAWAGDIEWRPTPRWQLRSALRYDPNRPGNDVTWASHMIGWEGSRRERLQARFLHRDREMKQTDVQMLLPLGERWRLALRYRRDLIEDRDLELLAALEYETCCMTVGIGAWRVRRGDGLPGEEYEKRLMLQVRFHGLAGFGEDLGARMRRQLDGEPAWSH